MKKPHAVTLCLALTVLCAATNGVAQGNDDYWPTWRGPECTGVAPKGNPPLTWSETENVKWKVELPGHGESSPIVWGDKIFVQTAIETDQQGEVSDAPASEEDGGRRRPFHGGRKPTNLYRFDVICLSRETGAVLWQKTACQEQPHEGHHPAHGFASFSPITDGSHVWASFGSRGLYCYDLDGKLVWTAPTEKMKTRAGFGEGSSPALAGDALIVVMDHEGDSYIVALDKRTGDPLWRKGRDEQSAWATPLAVDVDGRLQVVVNATSFVRGYDALTGDVVWQCGGQTANVVPTPVQGHGVAFCTSGFRGNTLHAIELGREGDLTGSDAIKWETGEATPYVPSPLLYGDKLYVTAGNRGFVSSYDAATGKAHYVKQSLEAMKELYASPVGAAGRIYFVGRDGVSQVIAHSDALQVLATNTLDDGFDASPAIVGSEMYLRGEKYLYCLAESG